MGTREVLGLEGYGHGLWSCGHAERHRAPTDTGRDRHTAQEHGCACGAMPWHRRAHLGPQRRSYTWDTWVSTQGTHTGHTQDTRGTEGSCPAGNVGMLTRTVHTRVPLAHLPSHTHPLHTRVPPPGREGGVRRDDHGARHTHRAALLPPGLVPRRCLRHRAAAAPRHQHLRLPHEPACQVRPAPGTSPCPMGIPSLPAALASAIWASWCPAHPDVPAWVPGCPAVPLPQHSAPLALRHLILRAPHTVGIRLSVPHCPDTAHPWGRALWVLHFPRTH